MPASAPRAWHEDVPRGASATICPDCYERIHETPNGRAPSLRDMLGLGHFRLQGFWSLLRR